MPSRWIMAAIIGAVAAVCTLAYVDLRREQARALSDFSAEQAALARALAATVAARIDAVFEDVATLGAVGDGEVASLARRLVRDRAYYHEIDLFDDRSEPPTVVVDEQDQPIAASPALAAERKALLAQAKDGGGPLVSAPLRRGAGARERLRLFVERHGQRAVVLLVDGDGFFEGARPAVSTPMRWLVVDEARRWIVLSPQATEATPWRSDDATSSTEVAGLLDRMSAGGDGVVRLGHAAAAALGLGPRTAVAAYARVRLRNEHPWSVGAVVSAMRVRDRARLAVWRLGTAVGLTALLVSLFGLSIVRQQRRAQGLAEALRLAEATAALHERSEKLVETIPIGVLALDRYGRVNAINPCLAERGVIAGVPLAEALPRATPDDVARLKALAVEARQTQRPRTRHGMRLHLDEDAPRELDVYAVPLARPLGEVDCFLVLDDRTEVRVLERKLVRAEKLATIGTLAAGVAHEVGTPLGIISGRAEQLLTKLPDGEAGEPLRKAVASILAQVDKVSTTIRQLLDFARVRPIEAARVTLAQVLSQAAELLEHRFRQARVTLSLDMPDPLATVAGDPGQLEQVFVNLLLNACDACAAGGHVVVRASVRDRAIEIDLIDDGVGIPPEHLSAVLDPFFTTKKRGQGTGLGLTIAADIVRNHGGTLELDSAVGRGTTVRVRLPVADAETA